MDRGRRAVEGQKIADSEALKAERSTMRGRGRERRRLVQQGEIERADTAGMWFRYALDTRLGTKRSRGDGIGLGRVAPVWRWVEELLGGGGWWMDGWW